MGRIRVLVGLATVIALGAIAPARAEFPYQPQGAPGQYERYFLPAAQDRPTDLQGKLNWMYAATAEADSPFVLDARELNGVRGAHLVDATKTAPQAWTTTTGRPDVTVGVTDSGIEWNNAGAMTDIRKKTRLNRGEVKPPVSDRVTSIENGSACSAYGAAAGGDPRDLNRDGVVNVIDYACDSRVALDSPNGVGPAGVLEPQDILIAFSDGVDDDGNGYVDDMVGWDFLDDDNDPFDDVQYGHGTGESRDSNAEADNGGELGSCPNCMVVHLRVGTSFVADVNRFAEAVVYATDNNVLVVQDALGTLNKSAFALDAIRYAYDHGTTVIASAADEAAQHHNQPSSMPYSIVVNSVTHFDDADQAPGPSPVSYLQFNGCTNFSSRITLAIPSVSCSSDATGRAAGMAGLVYAAAMNAVAAGRLAPHPTCRRPDGTPCVVTPNEVRQIMASGLVNGVAVADDVNFAQTPLGQSTELSCLPVAVPACTDPFLSAPTTRPGEPGASYPARKGHDQFYGYGRVNMRSALDAVIPATPDAPSRIPPEVEVTSPNWFDMVDPAAATMTVDGHVDNRGGLYTCRVYAAAGSNPGSGDFKELVGTSTQCDGTPRTGAFDGRIATVPMATLKGLFPASTNFSGREPGAGAQTYGGRPNTEPYGFVVKVLATATSAGVPTVPLVGQDRRQAYLHRDADMLEGFPQQLPGDAESSPVLADLDGDNENELVIANSDGIIHAFERAGGEAPGWPQTTGAVRPGHSGAPGYSAGGVARNHEAVLATPAVGDLDGDGTLEVVVADLDRHVRVFGSDGTLRHDLVTNPRFAGIPGEPFVNLRKGTRNRTQPGAIGSPVLADLDGDGKQEIVLASMDRHVYAWHADGSPVDGWPVLVIDRSKVAAVDPQSHQITFNSGRDGDDGEQQGAIVDTPAVGDLNGDGKPEIVIGTNEEYAEPINAGGLDQALYAPLGEALAPGNGRLFAIRPGGVADRLRLDNDVYLPGWPFKVGILQRGLLPLVGEGITGSPVIGNVPCNGPASGVRIGTIPAAGLGYLVNPDGVSCYGKMNGLDRALPAERSPTAAVDPVFLAAVGHPAFGTLAGKPSFLAPVAGVTRALDVVLPEYQGGRDYLAAWDTASGELAPGWPAPVNDLQFLTGPSLADIDGIPGQEVVGGTASDDLYGFTGAGTPIDAAWPKLTGDWMVMHPVIGTWGSGATKVLVTGTRNGRLLGYDTGASACAAAEWPQFHHDPANSGDARRDAVAPGHPTEAVVDGTMLKFKATGDDLQCGTASAYQVVTSPDPITPANFKAASPLVAPQTPGAAGTEQSLPLVGDVKRYVAVRAVDEHLNVGRPQTVDRGSGPLPTPTPTVTVTPTGTATAEPTGTATGTATAQPTSTSTASPTGTATAEPTSGPTVTPTHTATPGPTSTATASPTSTATAGPTTTAAPTTTASPCVDTQRPYSHFVRRRLTRKRVDLAGRTREPGCARMTLIQVAVSKLARRGPDCRPLNRGGRLGKPRLCGRLKYLRAKGGRPWRLRLRAHLPRGRYLIAARVRDAAGNVERPSSRNRVRVRVK